MLASSLSRTIVPACAALALAACGPSEEETTLEADATDLSGGEFIVNEEDPEAVPVDTPQVPMTPVPQDEMDASTPAEGEPTTQ